MKKMVAIIILVNLCVFAQSTNYAKYTIGIRIASNSDHSQATYTNDQNKHGFITGSIYWGKKGSLGVSSDLNSSFFNSFSDYFWLYEKIPLSKLEDQKYLELISKDNEFDNQDLIVNYSFFPQKTGTDTVILYCKYDLYKKKSVLSSNRFTYEISFNECLLKVELDKDEELNIWENEFPELKMTLTCSREEVNPIAQNRESLLSDLNEEKLKPIDIYDISHFRVFGKNSDLGKTNFSMGMELIRTDKQGDQILMKRTYSPLKVFSNVNTKEGVETFDASFYSGLVTAPFQIYNPHKIRLLNQSKNSSSRNVFYSVLAVPLKKENGKYSFQLAICQGVANGRTYSLKKIELGIDEKIKIELNPTNWTWQENINGERLLLDSKTDYNIFVNDYIILSLESDK